MQLSYVKKHVLFVSSDEVLVVVLFGVRILGFGGWVSTKVMLSFIAMIYSCLLDSSKSTVSVDSSFNYDDRDKFRSRSC